MKNGVDAVEVLHRLITEDPREAAEKRCRPGIYKAVAIDDAVVDGISEQVGVPALPVLRIRLLRSAIHLKYERCFYLICA